MGDFFKSVQFKILALLLALVFAFALRSAQTGTAIPMISKLTGALLTPAQSAATTTVNSTRQFFTEYFSGPRLADENEQLRSELNALRNQLVEYDRIKAENEQLKNYLDIKDENPDFDFEPAMVIGRDASDRFYSFTIDKGSHDGVAENDPVITEAGLVGIVSEVGISHAKVLTILDATENVGVMDSRTREIGAANGELTLAEEGLLKVNYLPRDGQSQPGDIIVTTGIGGLYPRGLIVGTIKELLSDSRKLSLYAVTEPPTDIRTVQNVLVIKYFDGQASAEQGE